MKVVLQNLTKIFPSRDKKAGKEVVAVNDFTFEIPDGKLIGLLGPSGCGKSTTLYMISGLQKPTAGKIFFGEDDVTELSTENRGIGLVFQNYALYPHMTVYDNNLKVVSNTAETFPVAPTWYGNNDHSGVMWGNKNAETTTVDDCRGKLYYYAWDGVYPEGATFTNATLEQVRGWVNDADAGFATWLGDRLGKDIRGKARDTQSMWPGSYQE